MNMPTYKITDFLGQEIEVTPKLFLYSVKDFMGKKMTIPGIQLYAEDEGALLPYATLTKSFGEFIGIKNSAYIDMNNCPFAHQLLTQGIAKETCFTKNNGFCVYPLWVFEESFFAQIGGEEYKEYSEAFDNYTPF